MYSIHTYCINVLRLRDTHRNKSRDKKKKTIFYVAYVNHAKLVGGGNDRFQFVDPRPQILNGFFSRLQLVPQLLAVVTVLYRLKRGAGGSVVVAIVVLMPTDGGGHGGVSTTPATQTRVFESFIILNCYIYYRTIHNESFARVQNKHWNAWSMTFQGKHYTNSCTRVHHSLLNHIRLLYIVVYLGVLLRQVQLLTVGFM